MPNRFSQNVIYKLECECDKKYIGLTTQQVHKRIKQHKDDQKLDLNDPRLNHATVEHSLKTGHDFAEIIDKGKLMENYK